METINSNSANHTASTGSSRKIGLNGLLSTAVLALLLHCPAIAAEKPGYAGLEFFGSSQLSRIELDKILRLKPGATYEQGEKAYTRLNEDLDKRNIKSSIEIVPHEGGNYFISVDVIDSGQSGALPTRKLQNAHHINLNNEKPFELLNELRIRLEKVQAEGRPASEEYQQGVRFYSDIPATRISEKLIQEMEGQERGIYKILSTDPNGERRADAVELLNWTAPYADNCLQLIAALDDSDARVRTQAAKYIWSHAAGLPDDFPFTELVEALSRQITRPSYHDRIRSMAALLAVAKRDSDSISTIKSFDESKLKEISQSSVIPAVQKMAQVLLSACANPPPIQRKSRNVPAAGTTGF